MPRLSSMHFRQTICSSPYQGGCSTEAHTTISVFGRCRASANAWETRTSQGKVPGGPIACASSSPRNVYFICRKAGRSPPSLMNCAKSGETCIPVLCQPCLGQRLSMCLPLLPIALEHVDRYDWSSLKGSCCAHQRAVGPHTRNVIGADFQIVGLLRRLLQLARSNQLPKAKNINNINNLVAPRRASIPAHFIGLSI